MNPPSLSDLMTRFLADPLPAITGGGGDVTPHEVLTAFRIDSRTAWSEAGSVLGLFGVAKPELAAPPEWAALVARAEMTAVPIAIGHYPQLARDVARLVTFEAGPVPHSQDADFPALIRWSKKASLAKSPIERLVAAAVFRLLGRWTDAELILQPDRGEGDGTRSWKALHANEVATLAFVKGEYESALRTWETQPESPAMVFNKGLANLTLGRKERAIGQFQKAISELPADGSWADLARLYQTIAEFSMGRLTNS